LPGANAPPDETYDALAPPQTSISLPVHTTAAYARAAGAPLAGIGVHVSVAGS
jgi:hypothetical protein